MNVRIIKAGHRHNGVVQPIGTVLELSDKVGLWLIDQGVAANAGAALLTKPPPGSFRPLRGCCGGRW